MEFHKVILCQVQLLGERLGKVLFHRSLLLCITSQLVLKLGTQLIREIMLQIKMSQLRTNVINGAFVLELRHYPSKMLIFLLSITDQK